MERMLEVKISSSMKPQRCRPKLHSMILTATFDMGVGYFLWQAMTDVVRKNTVFRSELQVPSATGVRIRCGSRECATRARFERKSGRVVDAVATWCVPERPKPAAGDAEGTWVVQSAYSVRCNGHK